MKPALRKRFEEQSTWIRCPYCNAGPGRSCYILRGAIGPHLLRLKAVAIALMTIYGAKVPADLDLTEFAIPECLPVSIASYSDTA